MLLPIYSYINTCMRAMVVHKNSLLDQSLDQAPLNSLLNYSLNFNLQNWSLHCPISAQILLSHFKQNTATMIPKKAPPPPPPPHPS